MRLRESDKKEIVRRFVIAQTAATTAHLKKKVEEAGQAIIEEFITEKQWTLIGRLPENFFHSGSHISAHLHGERFSQTIALGRTYRIPEHLRYGNEPVSPGASARYLKATENARVYEEKKKDLRLACERTLRNVSTMRRLQEVWKEGAALLPEEAKIDRQVPVVTCAGINEALANLNRSTEGE